MRQSIEQYRGQYSTDTTAVQRDYLEFSHAVYLSRRQSGCWAFDAISRRTPPYQSTEFSAS
jgi:hypothetical protein